MPAMRTTTRILVCALALGLVAVGTSAAVVAKAQFRGSLSAQTHTPTVNARWAYVVAAKTFAGRPLQASAHLQVFENGKRVDIVGWRKFKGVLRGTKRWPASTRGHHYMFQALVIATGANGRKSTLALNYAVTPR
jgi:ribosomal protein L3